MGDGVALARGPVTVELHGLLAVEVHRRVVAVEVVEHRREGLPSLEDVGRGLLRAVHVDGKAGVGCEERHLSLSVAAVGAVRVGVEQLADREAVGSLGRGELGAGGVGHSPTSCTKAAGVESGNTVVRRGGILL